LKVIRIIILSLIHHFLYAQNAPIFELKEGFKSNSLEGYVSRFDAENSSSIKQIFKEKGFVLSKEIPQFRADKKNHWLRIHLKSAKSQKLILEYQQIFIDELEFYLFENDSLKQKNSSSWEIDFSEKAFPSRYHAFEFGVESYKNYTLLLRCQNSKINFSNRAFLRLFDKKIYEKEEDFYLFHVSLSIGCLLLVALFSLGFFVYSRKNIYVYYFDYLISIAVYILVVNGVFNQYFNPKNSFFAQPDFGSVLVIFNLVFHILYVYEFFKIKQFQSKYLNFAFIFFVLLNFIQIFIILIFPQKTFPFAYIYLSFIAVILTSIFMSIRQKRKEPYLYLLASGPAFLTFIFVILGAIGLTKISTVFFYYSHVTFALEGLGLGLALLYQFHRERKEIEAELEKNRIETTQKILLAQEEERRKLALDLHDDLGGSLSVLNRELDELNEKNAQILTKSVNLTQKIVADLRTVSHHLMPSSFEEKGLVKVVEESIEMANRQSKVYFIFVCNGEEKRQNLDTEINIYRIIKELINNVLKHSEAKQAVVQLIFFDEFLYVSVEDDGKGFDFSSQQSWGIGLNNINLRSQYLKAKLTTESSPSGTLISLEIPYNVYENQNLAG